MPDRIPSPEQPDSQQPEAVEHEEARRQARIDAIYRDIEAWVEERFDEWREAVATLEHTVATKAALLAKAEQTATQLKTERDELDRKWRVEYDREVEGHGVTRNRTEAAERELERLRIALAQVDIPGLPPFVRRIVQDALSADTQREP